MRRPLVFLTAALIGCGGDPLPQEPPAAVDPASLRINLAGPDHLLMGRTVALEVTAARQSGLAVDVAGRVAFRSTRPEALTVDGAGLVTVADSGSGFIVASVEIEGRTLADSVRIVGIDPGFTISLSLSGGSNHYTVPQSGPLTVATLDRNGNPIAAPVPVSLRSTDTTAFRVDAGGTVSAVGPGEAYIIASATTMYGELADSVRMVAVCTAELQLKLATPPALPFRVGMTFPMDATIRTCGGAIGFRPTEWRSLDPAVVSIDIAGALVRAVAPGTTTIVVTAELAAGELEVAMPLTVAP